MVWWLENDEEIAIFPALRINLSNQRGTWHEIEPQPIHFQYEESFYDFFKNLNSSTTTSKYCTDLRKAAYGIL